MRELLGCVGVVLMAAAIVQAQGQTPSSTGPEGVVERPFAAGGTVRLDLAAGEYRIVGTSAEKVLVRWRTRESDDGRKVRIELQANGKESQIRTHGPKNGFEVRIEVPERSDIDLDLSAGDLSVRGIKGNKRVDVWAGDVSIEMGEREAYRRVDAAVKFGEIDARPFDVNKGGLFRSFTWEGAGGYSLRARLFAGDLKLLR
jgi:hypothetical protein